uniref:(California timema) hypothetical protein n=1 Tax=Timema californicum TaxID=61474 RepID=A0A7R9J8E0_TIMCA|nr:unnamed protein product [Timema californicum]
MWRRESGGKWGVSKCHSLTIDVPWNIEIQRFSYRSINLAFVTQLTCGSFVDEFIHKIRGMFSLQRSECCVSLTFFWSPPCLPRKHLEKRGVGVVHRDAVKE